VDFLFVEHTQYDCIEIIGTCVPTAVRHNNNNINSATAGGCIIVYVKNCSKCKNNGKC
jgi:hypothetical protein